jgi:hypothetical protein
MITLLTLFLFGVFIIIAYSLGLKNGQRIENKEEIQVPIIDTPNNDYKEIEENEQFYKDQEKMIQILENIEAYDGTSKGQKVVK